MPVITIMAWTFLSVGGVTRAKAVDEEIEVRALHAAEAGLRFYLATGETKRFEMNDCEVELNIFDSRVVSTAIVKRSRKATSVSVRLERGFTVERKTNEEY